MSDKVRLDCSELRDVKMRIEGNLPNSIYVDGQDFINRLRETFLEIGQMLEIRQPEPTKEKEITVAEAVKVLTSALKNDPTLYSVYQASIALAIVDTYRDVESTANQRGYAPFSFAFGGIYSATPEGGKIKTEVLSHIANKAAIKFLDSWSY